MQVVSVANDSQDEKQKKQQQEEEEIQKAIATMIAPMPITKGRMLACIQKNLQDAENNSNTSKITRYLLLHGFDCCLVNPEFIPESVLYELQTVVTELRNMEKQTQTEIAALAVFVPCLSPDIMGIVVSYTNAMGNAGKFGTKIEAIAKLVKQGLDSKPAPTAFEKALRDGVRRPGMWQQTRSRLTYAY